MGHDGGGEVHEGSTVLELTRSHDGQQAFNGGSERALGGIVRGFDTRLVHEGKEVLIVHEEGIRQVADVVVGSMEMPFAECEEPLFERQHFVDQLRAGERGPTRGGMPAESLLFG
jgi:hypothetical protein